MELSEFGLKLEPNVPVKAQCLVDFITKHSPFPKPDNNDGGNWWMLYVDGSCNPMGSGVGITLEGPGDISHKKSLRFDFKTFNNQVECEALIAVLKLANEVRVKKVWCKSDFKLVTGRVNGEFQAKDAHMQRYYLLMEPLLYCSEEYELIHIPHEDNNRDDILSRLVSSKRLGHHKTFI